MTKVIATRLAQLDGWIPEGALQSDSTSRLRLRLLVGASVVTGFIALPYVFIYALVFGAPQGALALTLAAVALLSTPMVLRRTGSSELAAHWFLGTMLFTLVALTALDGGQGAAIYGFPILPMFAAGASNNRSAWIWSAASIAAVLGLAVATAAGVPFPHELTPANHTIFHPAVAIGIVIAIALPAMLYRALADNAIAEVAAKEAEIRAIVDGAADAILSIDREGRVQSANRAAERLFERPSADLLGRRLAQLVQGTWTLDAAVHEVIVHRAAGPLQAEIAVERVKDPTVERHVATVRDLTLRKDAERTIADARDQALEATRAKSGFLANMSHELRTPLNAIIGYSEMLAEDADPSAIEDLNRIGGAGRHLLRLINDILDLSKIEAGRMELQPEWIDVRALCQGVVGTVGPLAEKQSNTLHVQVGATAGQMWADPTRMRQVLLNLLSNASKFTERGRITLSAHREAVEGVDWLSFTVTDTGIGIAAAKLEHIFSEFSQADSSTTRKYGGTGLGLAITRRLCGMMGGDVTVMSAPGEGSRFTVRVPAGVAPPVRRPTSKSLLPADEMPTDGPLVVVIDDDPDARELLVRTLVRGGFRAEAASDGRTGLELCRRLMPSAVTLDVLMPGMDGWQVLGALKADPALARIPVVLVSMLDDRSMGFALGATQHLTKPVDRDALIAALEPYRVGKPGRALVVEDDVALRELVSRTLERAGWQVLTAADGQEGLAAVEAGHPDLVLLDLMMPVMDGFQFLAHLREQPRWQALPVIVVTARDLSPEERSRLQAQAQRVLQKAVTSQEDLLRQVSATVARFAPSTERVA